MTTAWKSTCSFGGSEQQRASEGAVVRAVVLRAPPAKTTQRGWFRDVRVTGPQPRRAS